MFKSFLKYLLLSVIISAPLFSSSFAEDEIAETSTTEEASTTEETIEENYDISYENLASDSVDLFWNWDDGIFYYQIVYWVSTEEWETKSTDLIDSQNYTLNGLKENTTYNFTVVWYNELWDEWFISNELELVTLTSENEAKDSFYLEDANMVSKSKIELTFSNPLDNTDWTQREFNIENINDINDYFTVVNTEISEDNENALIIELDWEPTIWAEYSVVALAITDKYNQTIENWVDLDATFIWIEVEEIVEEEIVEEEVISEEVNEEEIIEEDDLNAASDEVVVETPAVTGTDLSADEFKNNVLNVADENTTLPETGPEQVLIFILAFILWALVFVFKFKRI